MGSTVVILLNRQNTSYTLEWALAQPITIQQNDYWVGSTYFYMEGGCIEPFHITKSITNQPFICISLMQAFILD